MPSAKLPLVGGIITPLHNGVAGAGLILNVLGAPTDKALQPSGIQAFYEIHLWLIPGPLIEGKGVDQLFNLLAWYDNDQANAKTVWSGFLPFLQEAGTTNNWPIKILDGYPMRGNVTLGMFVDAPAGGAGYTIDMYPIGAQAYGYAYRVGQGTVVEPERRFIGDESPDGVSEGVPIEIPPSTKTIIHTFEQNRIDEISLAFMREPVEANSGDLQLLFEDVNNNPLILGHAVFLNIPPTDPNYLRDPQSMYTIDKAVFGGGLVPTLDHISVLTDASVPTSTFVHGYFTRR